MLQHTWVPTGAVKGPEAAGVVAVLILHKLKLSP